MTLKKDLEKILTTRHKFTGEKIVPKIKVYDDKRSCTILGMPRRVTKLQIDMLMCITKGIDYTLVVQRGSDKYMMIMIQKPIFIIGKKPSGNKGPQ